MAQIIDLSLKQSSSRATFKSQRIAHKFKKKLNLFNYVVKGILEKDFEISQLSVNGSELRMITKTIQRLLGGSIYQKIVVNLQLQQIFIQCLYKKNFCFFPIPIKQCRINIFRHLLKLSQLENYIITVDSSTGLIYGKTIKTISSDICFKFLVKSIFQSLRSFQTSSYLILNLANQLPRFFFETILKAKKEKIMRVNIVEENLIKKINKYLLLSTSPLSIVKQKVVNQSIRIEQKYKTHQNFSQTILKDSIIALYSYNEEASLQFQNFSQEEKKNLLEKLKTTTKGAVHNENKNVFNQILVQHQPNLKMKDINPKGRNKILLTKLKLRYIKIDNEGGQIEKYPLPVVHSKFICIKCPAVSSQANEKKAIREVEIVSLLRDVECPYFPKYYLSTQENFDYRNRLMMDYLLLDSQNIAKFLCKHLETFSTAHKNLIFTKIALALFTIHSKDIIHMDLSLSNVYIQKNQRIKVIDFGQSYQKDIFKQQKHYSPGYTLPFTPPEKFSGGKFCTQYDMYSFMVLVHQIFFDRSPFSSDKFLERYLSTNSFTKRFYFCPESYCYFGYEKQFDILLALMIKGLKRQSQLRPFPSWIIIILKQIFYWTQEYITISVIN